MPHYRNYDPFDDEGGGYLARLRREEAEQASIARALMDIKQSTERAIKEGRAPDQADCWIGGWRKQY
jgi:hypothetical protein